MPHAPTSPYAGLLAPLEALVAWGNTLPIPGSTMGMHRLCRWHFHADMAPSCLWLDHRHGAASAHQQLERTAKMEELGRDLDAALRAAGVLSIGLRCFDVDLHPGNRNAYATSDQQVFRTLLRARHSNRVLGEKDANRTPKAIVGYMDEALPVLARVPMDHNAPLKAYVVDAYHVAAPTPQAAAALHLGFTHPARLDRVLRKGPDATHHLEIHEVLTKKGEYLFCDLVDRQAA